MRTWNIPLQRIELDQMIQPRAELDDKYTEELVNELKEGRLFPPVVVFQDLDDYWLADGFHRYVAHQKAGLGKIKAEVLKGGKRTAMLHSVSANSTHGKRRTNADKRKVVLTLLKDQEWGCWTDRFIAGKCRVSQPFVSAIRKELTDNGYKFPEKRTATNGRKMKVAKIGSTHSQNSQKSKAPAKKSLPVAGNENPPQRTYTTSSKVDYEIQTLKTEVNELKAALQSKERVIKTLKAEIWAIESENAYSQAVA